MRRVWGETALIWVALLGLLALTAGTSFVLTGPLSGIVNLAIAVAKAGLVLWFYMDLREERGFIRFAALAGFGWLLILMTLASTDYLTR